MTSGASRDRGVVDGVKTVTYRGRTRTLREWSELRGIKTVTLHTRYDAGWPAAELLGYKSRLPRTVRTVTYKGETLTVSEWAKKLKVSRTSINERYDRRYNAAQILSLEPLPEEAYFIKKARTYTRSDGQTGTLKEWAERLGRKVGTLDARITRGWSHDRALELPGLGRDSKSSRSAGRTSALACGGKDTSACEGATS